MARRAVALDEHHLVRVLRRRGPERLVGPAGLPDPGVRVVQGLGPDRVADRERDEHECEPPPDRHLAVLGAPHAGAGRQALRTPAGAVGGILRVSTLEAGHLLTSCHSPNDRRSRRLTQPKGCESGGGRRPPGLAIWPTLTCATGPLQCSTGVAAEAERHAVARELDDETLQGIAAVRVMLVSSRWADEGELRTTVAHATDELQGEVDRSRDIIHDARPSSLDDPLGLMAAMEALVATHAHDGGPRSNYPWISTMRRAAPRLVYIPTWRRRSTGSPRRRSPTP